MYCISKHSQFKINYTKLKSFNIFIFYHIDFHFFQVLLLLWFDFDIFFHIKSKVNVFWPIQILGLWWLLNFELKVRYFINDCSYFHCHFSFWILFVIYHSNFDLSLARYGPLLRKFHYRIYLITIIRLWILTLNRLWSSSL